MQTQASNLALKPPPAGLGAITPGATYQSPRCLVALYQVTPNLVFGQIAGHIDRGAAEALKNFGEKQLARGVTQRFFHDWEAVSGYDTEARTMLTQWSLDRRNQIPEVVVLTQSKIVAMGVATANLATSVVGVQMRSHTLRAPFERELVNAARGA